MSKPKQSGERPVDASPEGEGFRAGEPKKHAGGAPRGSINAIRHGLVAGKLPASLEWVEKKTNAFRRGLERQVLDLKGEISVSDACSINSACKWERHGMLALNWLRELQQTDAAISERLRFSEAAAKASDARDRNIAALRLDVKPEPLSLDQYIIETTSQRSEL